MKGIKLCGECADYDKKKSTDHDLYVDAINRLVREMTEGKG